MIGSNHGSAPFPRAFPALIGVPGSRRALVHQHTGSIHADGDHFDLLRPGRIPALLQRRGDRDGGQRPDQAREVLHKIHRHLAGMIFPHIAHHLPGGQFHQFPAHHLREFRGGRAHQTGRPVHGVIANPARAGLKRPAPHHRTAAARFHKADFLFLFGGEAASAVFERLGAGVAGFHQMPGQGGPGGIDLVHQQIFGFQHGSARRDGNRETMV